MKKSLLSFSALVLSLISAQASATMQEERWPRWYVGLSGGVQFLKDDDIRGASTGKAKFKTGETFTGSLGYMPHFGVSALENLRFEAELGYHNAGLDGGTVNGVLTPGRGHVQAWSYLGNVFYDFRNSTRWTPYLGAGAGGARVQLSRNSGLGNTGDESGVFAYQFMAGLAYAPENIPMTEWSLGYRYFVMQDPEYNSPAGKLKLRNLDSNNVELGAKFRF